MAYKYTYVHIVYVHFTKRMVKPELQKKIVETAVF